MVRLGIKIKKEEAGGNPMTQVTNDEPDALPKSDLAGNGPGGIPAIGTPERAALVNAIKLNFPEIYVALENCGIGESYAQPPEWSSPSQPPPGA